MLIFGCPASKGVSAESKLAVDLFAKLRELKKEDGSVICSGRFLKWSPGDGGEILPLCTHDLRLFHKREDQRDLLLLEKVHPKPISDATPKTE